MKVCLQDTPVILIQNADNSKHGRKNMYILSVSPRGLGDPLSYTKKCSVKGLVPPYSYIILM